MAYRFTFTTEGAIKERLLLSREFGLKLLHTTALKMLNEMMCTHTAKGTQFEGVIIFNLWSVLDMEITTEMASAAVVELKNARKELEETANQIKALKEVALPELEKYARDIRTMRMTAVSEMGNILNEMRQVHKFFIESSYEREMKELERFVALCKEIQKLKADGVFDAVCDSAIRLALKEPRE